MGSEARQAGHSPKVAVQRKDCGGVLDRYAGNNGIRRSQADALRSRQAEEGCGTPISLETARFQEVKKREIVFDAFDVALQALEDLRHDYASDCHRRTLLDQSPEFVSGRTWPGTEEIDPDRAVHQDQARFLRIARRSPFQTPRP